MIEICGLKFRDFSIKINGEILKFYPPKIKVLRNLFDVARGGTIDDTVQAVCIILNTNDKQKTFDASFVEENFDIDELYDFLSAYVDWINETKSNPNFVSPV